jgi:hypothetical protein
MVPYDQISGAVGDTRRLFCFEDTAAESLEMQRPIRGAQRRIEARIGQLLGPAARGNPDFGRDRNCVPTSVSKDDRVDFRLLARALDGECYLTLEDGRTTWPSK